METLERTMERNAVGVAAVAGERRGAVPMAAPGSARTAELTPAQRRAVMYAQQQVLKARAARKAKDEREEALRRMWREEDGVETAPHGDGANAPTATDAAAGPRAVEGRTVTLRGAIGHVLRDLRTRDHKTLREVSEKAGVSLGYLSEVERGQKEASSELLGSIAEALGVSAAQMLRLVADYLDSATA